MAKFTEIEYRGYVIAIGFYRKDDITVQFMGDDIFFPSVAEAKSFIDDVTN